MEKLWEGVWFRIEYGISILNKMGGGGVGDLLIRYMNISEIVRNC